MCSVLNCLTMIVAGLCNPVTRRRTARFIIKEQVKLVCLQETHLKEGEVKYLREIFQGTLYNSTASSRSKEVVIGISNEVPRVPPECILDLGGQ